jgi:hypothetical protein
VVQELPPASTEPLAPPEPSPQANENQAAPPPEQPDAPANTL